MKGFVLFLTVMIFVSASASIADNKVVVVPLNKSVSMDIKVVRNANSTSPSCSTMSLRAECPSGYKVIGGSIDCGADGFLFSSKLRAVNWSSKAWEQEAWAGSCVDLSDPTVIPGTCAPAFVEAICIKIN